MKLNVGCDVVSISRFSNLLREGGEKFMERLFSPKEYVGATVEHLAGIFAAKEAACKALQIPAGNWLSLQVSHLENGAPKLEINLPVELRNTPSQLSLSISHDQDYAFAVVIAQHSPSLNKS